MDQGMQEERRCLYTPTRYIIAWQLCVSWILDYPWIRLRGGGGRCSRGSQPAPWSASQCRTMVAMCPRELFSGPLTSLPLAARLISSIFLATIATFLGIIYSVLPYLFYPLERSLPVSVEDLDLDLDLDFALMPADNFPSKFSSRSNLSKTIDFTFQLFAKSLLANEKRNPLRSIKCTRAKKKSRKWFISKLSKLLHPKSEHSKEKQNINLPENFRNSENP